MFTKWEARRQRNARVAVVIALADGALGMDAIEFRAGLSRARALRALGSLVSDGTVEVVPLEELPLGSAPTLRYRLRESR